MEPAIEAPHQSVKLGEMRAGAETVELEGCGVRRCGRETGGAGGLDRHREEHEQCKAVSW
jgi:hypothetical protein